MWRIGRRADVELIPYADSAAQALDLWRIAGRKALGHDGQRLWLHGEYGRELVALMLSPGLQDGAPFAYALPAGADPECYRFTLEAALMLLQLGGTATPATLRRPPRTAVMHMRTLQALDGAEVGAGQREIAGVLFGRERVAAEWQPDSELRAQVRYLLQRGRRFVEGGYRDLLN